MKKPGIAGFFYESNRALALIHHAQKAIHLIANG
jgi:hypothetical protein